jgi:6-phosphogluconolactonase
VTDGPELQVAEDLAAAGVELFLEAAPRTLILAGGSTPRPLYERLARTSYQWDQVDVFFSDERCVAPSHPDSNFGMVDRALLSKVPAWPHPMKGCDPDAYELQLSEVFGPRIPRFDLEFLGLGDDGHTASLFPGDPVLEIIDRLAARVNRPDHPRLTLTLPVLSAGRLAVFLVAGASKQAALGALLEGGDIPAARVRAERVVVLADPDAAG